MTEKLSTKIDDDVKKGDISPITRSPLITEASS
jgi:hypothetical protein